MIHRSLVFSVVVAVALGATAATALAGPAAPELCLPDSGCPEAPALPDATFGVFDPLGAPDAENVPSVQQPNVANLPVFNAFFGADFAWPGSQTNDVSVAVGGDRVFVSSESGNVVRSYDARTLALTGFAASVSAPRGIAYYRGEVFVLNGDGEVVVLDAMTGTERRRLVHPVSLVYKNIKVFDGIQITGVDVAWGEAWLTFNGGAGGGGVSVLDARTGALKAVTWQMPRYDCYANPYDFVLGSPDYCSDYLKNDYPSTVVVGCDAWQNGYEPRTQLHEGYRSLLAECRAGVVQQTLLDRFDWWDISTVPELRGVIAQCRFIDRDPLIAPTAASGVTDLLNLGRCDNGYLQDGTDAVWGMKWFLSATADERSGKLGAWIREYSLNRAPTPAGDVGLESPRRSWQPKDAASNNHRDVAYNNRETRIDATGPLMESDWLRGSKCVDYVVSDADIYVVGWRGERWYELARNFEQIELRVDGQRRAGPSTSAQGQFCIDVNGLSNGVHTLELVATVAGRTVVARNERLRIDYETPSGELASPENLIRGTLTFEGLARDGHSGVGAWTLEVQREGDASWSRPCAPVTTPDSETGRFRCAWASASGQYPDGIYRLRAEIRDQSSDGGNIAHSRVWDEIEVDNVSDGYENDYGDVFGPEGSPGLPETFFEPDAPDTAPDEDNDEVPATTSDASLDCASDESFIQELTTDYAETPLGLNGFTTPELALTKHLALPGGPQMSIALFREASRDSDTVVYLAADGSAPRAFVEVFKTETGEWLGGALIGCSRFLARFDPEVTVSPTGSDEADGAVGQAESLAGVRPSLPTGE